MQANTSLRASDVLSLKVVDVWKNGWVELFYVIQKKNE